MGYAFISYSTKNQAAADAMNALLRQHGVGTWMAPGDIPPGSTYARAINVAIRECACVVFLLSKESQDSVWVAKEIERAINYRKTIFPVQLDDVVLNDEFELYISSNQLIRMAQVRDTHPEASRLLSCVKQLTGEYAAMEQSTEQPSTLSTLQTTANTPPRSDIAEEASAEFKDISYALYDKNDLHIEFCNFEVSDDEALMSFWIENGSDDAIRLWMMEGTLDDQYESSLNIEHICDVPAGESQFGKLPVKNLSPAGSHRICAHIEIDDTENRERDRTPTFSIAVDFDHVTQELTLPENTSADEDGQDETVKLEDISYALYDKGGLHIEFCNFEVEDGDVFMSFWAKNYSDRNVRLFAVKICVDGKANFELDFELLGAVEPNDTGFCGLSLRNIVPVGTHTVKGYIEIDDMNNFALDRTPDFSIDVDFGTGLQEVTLCESTTTSNEENEQGLSESEEVEFHEDIEFHAYSENGIDVQFCNFVIENEETVSFNFWVYNGSEEAINVYAQDVYVDGEFASLFEKIGFYKPNEYGYGRFTLSEITPDTYYTIKAFIEIDNETSDQCIDKGTPFVIDVDFSSGELSAREE